MLASILKNAIKNLQELIELTKLDIDDIKKANHEAIFERLQEKNYAIANFEKNKGILQEEIYKLSSNNPNKNIGDLLDIESSRLIEKVRSSLETLKEINKQYARSVIAVHEFYSAIIENIIPTQRDGYSNKSYSKVDLLHIEA